MRQKSFFPMSYYFELLHFYIKQATFKERAKSDKVFLTAFSLSR
jgi:hypothetical protein